MSESTVQKSVVGKKTGITRRGFLKATGAIAGATALAGGTGTLTALAEDNSNTTSTEEVFSGVCRGNCGGGCSMRVTVREGKVVRVDPAELENGYTRICQRGRSHAQYIYSDRRIKYPMRRTGERGAGEWERISWEDAINEICTKWKQDIKDYGPSSLAFSTGLGNYGVAFGAWYGAGYINKLLNALNATNLSHLYDYASGVYGNMTNISGSIMPHHLRESGCVVLWSYNITDAYPHTWRFIAEAQENGTKLVVVDPNYTTSAAKADLWVRLRPGTDGALALTLVNMAVERGCVDVEEIKTHTTLPFLIKESGGLLHASDVGLPFIEELDEEVVVDPFGAVVLASECSDPVYTGINEVQGIKVKTVYDATMENAGKWTIDRCSEVCGLEPDVIEEFFGMYINNPPVASALGMGIDHYSNGTMTYIAIALLCSITGNMSKVGGGADLFIAPPVPMVSNAYGLSMEAGMSSSPDVPMNMLPEIMETEKFNGEDLPIKNIFIAYHNAIANQVSRLEMIEALKKAELVVVSDIIMNDTTQWADIILPACHWFEQQDTVLIYHPNITLQERAIDPLYESKSNYEIIQMLAKGMGIEDVFPETEDEAIRLSLASEALKDQGIDYDIVLEKKVVPIKFEESTGFGSPDQRANYYFGKGGRWVNSGVAGGYYEYGQDIDWSKVELPTWYPPYEAWTQDIDDFQRSDASKRYPLVFTTFRSKMRTHTQFAYNPWLLELYNEPIIMANIEDLKARGIAPGDIVKLFNERGYVVAKVVENAGIYPGMVVMTKGWQGDQFIEGHYSNLTSRYMNPASSNCYFFDTVCEMEPYN